MLKTECNHYTDFAKADVTPNTEQCEVCGISGPSRMCITCGFVGCCESLNSHDTEHWRQTGHPIIARMPYSDASWLWCYEHNDYLRDTKDEDD